MANAFFHPLVHLFASLQALLGGFGTRPAPARPATTTHAPSRRATPLRVVRVVEPSAQRADAGRMVISGRLADVCAELERLAALEARNEAASLPRAVGWR